MDFLRCTQIIHERKLFSAHIRKNSTTGCFAPCAETPNLDQYIPRQWHSLISGHRCEIFHVSWLHIPLHLFNNSTMLTSSSCSVQQYQTGPWIFVIRPRDQVSEPEPAAFDQMTGLKSLSIYLFLLARLNLGLQMDRLPVQASQDALCSEREREREGKRKKAV